MKKLLTAALLVSILTSCNTYYKAALGTKRVTANAIEELKKENKYFILRDGSQSFAMNDITFSADRNILHCTLGTLPEEHTLHLTNGINGKMKYAKEQSSAILNEVHVYTVLSGNAVNGNYNISLDHIQKIEMLVPDEERTRRSRNTGIYVGVGATVVAVAVIAVVTFQNSFSIGSVW